MSENTLNVPIHEFESDNHCTKGALTGMFGWLLQFILALLAFTGLIVKRYCEPRFERRPWIIWFFDTSKQAFGELFMHMSNIFISGHFQGDPCTWYIINFLLDSTIGLLLIYIGIRLTQMVANERKWNAIRFGEYGVPPTMHAWVLQCCLFLFIMFVVKAIITLLIQFRFWSKVRQIMLYPIPNQDVELAVVMLIIPLVVNTLMFWVTDNFLKHQSKAKSVMQCRNVRIHYSHMKPPKNESDSDVVPSTDEELLGESIQHHRSSVLT